MRRCEDEQMWRWERCEDVRMWICADVKMWGCEDVKMWRWEDVKLWRWEGVKMRRCEDQKMRRWEDVKIRRCEDKKMMWRCEDVKMRRCEDEKLWRWEDEIQTPAIGRTLRSDALGKNVWMSRNAKPATRNEATRCLKHPKMTPSAELTIGHGHTALTRTLADGCERLRTVANGCERKRNVERTHPQSLDPQSETEPLLHPRLGLLDENQELEPDFLTPF